MEKFFNDLYKMTIQERWKFEVVKVNEIPGDDESTYEVIVSCTDLSDESADPQLFNLQYYVPNTVSGVVNNNEFNKVTITSAKLRPAIKYYNSGIKIPGMYIDYGNEQVELLYGEYYMNLYGFFDYFNLLDKVYPDFDRNYLVKLTDEEKKALQDFQIDERVITKLKLMLKTQDVSNKLDKKFISQLLELGEQENKELITPLDFVYLDVIGGLVSELYTKLGEFRLTNIHNFFNNGNLYPTTVQNVISRYFRLQATNFRNVQSSQDVNALSIASQTKKIYFYGKNQIGNYDKLQLYNNYFVGVLDPNRTHDGPNINKDNDLTINTQIEDGDIYITLLDKNFNRVKVPYSEYCLKAILSENQVDEKNRRIVPDNGVYVVYQYGEYHEVTDPNEIDYYRPAANLLSPSTALVPFINRSDSTRAMLGAHMIRQAIPVEGATPGIVHTFETERLYKESGLNIKSPVNGKVIDMLNDNCVKIQSESGDVRIVKSPGWFNSKMSTTNIFNPVVKIGDEVKEGQPVFSINSFKDGEFAVGVQLYTAFTTYLGHDHEDGIILTEQAAKKFDHPMMQDIIFELPNNAYYQFNDEEIPGDKSKYSQFGLIESGKSVVAGEPLFSFWVYADENSRYGKLKKIFNAEDVLHHEIMKTPAKITSGIVKNVRVLCQYPSDNSADRSFIEYYEKRRKEQEDKYSEFTGDMNSTNNYEFDSEGTMYKIVITIEYFNHVKLSDKFSNRYGSKGVCTYIIPEAETPQDEHGNKIDVIMSPLSTFSRKNPSQVFETKLGLVGKMGFKSLEKWIESKDFESASRFLTEAYPDSEGTWTQEKIEQFYNQSKKYEYIRFEVSPFDQFYDDEKINKLLEMIGMGDGRTKIFYPVLGKWTNNPVTVGYSEIIRLQFIAENKATTTSMLNLGTGLPFGLGNPRLEGQKIGNQEIWALQSHGKSNELAQIASENQDKESVFLSSLLALGLSIE